MDASTSTAASPSGRLGARYAERAERVRPARRRAEAGGEDGEGEEEPPRCRRRGGHGSRQGSDLSAAPGGIW